MIDSLLLLPMGVVLAYMYYDLFTYDRDALFKSCASSDSPLLLEYSKKCHNVLRSNSTANASPSNVDVVAGTRSGSTSKEYGAH
jgi:hypothetical protein